MRFAHLILISDFFLTIIASMPWWYTSTVPDRWHYIICMIIWLSMGIASVNTIFGEKESHKLNAFAVFLTIIGVIGMLKTMPDLPFDMNPEVESSKGD